MKQGRGVKAPLLNERPQMRRSRPCHHVAGREPHRMLRLPGFAPRSSAHQAAIDASAVRSDAFGAVKLGQFLACSAVMPTGRLCPTKLGQFSTIR